MRRAGVLRGTILGPVLLSARTSLSRSTSVEGDHAHALARGALVEDLRVQTEHLLDVGRRKTLKDPAHRSVGGCAPPVQLEGLLEPVQVDIDEAVDRAVGIGPRHDREDREQKHVGQPVKLAFRPAQPKDLAPAASGQKQEPDDVRLLSPAVAGLPVQDAMEPSDLFAGQKAREHPSRVPPRPAPGWFRGDRGRSRS